MALLLRSSPTPPAPAPDRPGLAARLVAKRLSATAAGVLAPHRPVLALVLLAAFLYLPSVWMRDLWNPDEPRYAEVARGMGARGDYFLPHLNGEVYGEKPPLLFWLGLGAETLPGVPHGSGTRLVSVIAALGTLLLTYGLGRRMMDREAAWLAALVLAGSGMFVLHATAGVIDGLLTFLVTAAIAAGLRAREERSPTLWGIFYALIGLGVLAKGPVALVIPAGVMLVLGLREQGVRGALALHPLWGVPLAAGVVALWLVPAIARGGQSYADIILFKQNVGRAFDSWHHKEPFTYFLRVFPASFLPWIAALPAALVSAWRERRRDPGSAAPLAWFVFTFLFFSIMSGKKTRYLMPLCPAAALLVGRDLARSIGRPSRRAAVALVLLLHLAAGVALIALSLGAGPAAVDRLEGLAMDQRESLDRLARMPGSLLLAIPGAAVAGAAAMGIARLRRDPRGSLAAAAAASLALAGWVQWVGVPALNVIKSPRALAETASEAASAGGRDAPIVLYRDAHSHMFNFYTGRDSLPKMTGADRTAAWLRDNPGAVVIAVERDLRALEERTPGLARLACRRVGEEVICAARTPPGVPAPP